MKQKLQRLTANLRLGTGILILTVAAAGGVLAQTGVGFFSKLKIGPSNNCTVSAGTGTPLGAVTGSVCDLFLRTDGGSGTTLYVKASGTGTNTGWEVAGSGGGSGGSGASPQVVVRKSADQSVTSSTVLVNDTHLFFNIAANENWAIRATLFVDAGSTGDLKIGLSVPSGGSYRLGRGALVNTSGTIDQAATSTTTLSVGGQGGGTIYAYTFYATVTNGSTAGTVTLQFAQDTSDGTATTLKTNSVLVADPVGSASAAVTAGSYVLLETKTMTGLSQVDFTAGFSSVYDDYEFHLIDVKPVVLNDDLLARFSTDGGSTYDSTAVYENAHHYVASNNTSAFAGATTNTSMDFGGDADNAATAVGINGILHLIDPGNTTNYKQFRGNVSYKHGTVGLININRSHLYRNAAAVNGVRFFYPGGNAAQGVIRMYGIAKSAGLSPGTMQTGALSARPTGAVDGRMYLPNDAGTWHRDAGGTWASWGPIYPFTIPSDTGFSWLNQGTSTLTATNDSLTMVANATGASTNIVARVKTAPATPWTVTAYIQPIPITKVFLGYGLLMRQNGAGSGQNRLYTCWWANGTAAAAVSPTMRIEKWTNATTFSASYQEYLATKMPSWFRMSDDGANVSCSISSDGVTWTQLHSVTRLDFLLQGADQVGFMAMTMNNATPNMTVPVTVLSWKEQ